HLCFAQETTHCAYPATANASASIATSALRHPCRHAILSEKIRDASVSCSRAAQRPDRRWIVGGAHYKSLSGMINRSLLPQLATADLRGLSRPAPPGTSRAAGGAATRSRSW